MALRASLLKTLIDGIKILPFERAKIGLNELPIEEEQKNIILLEIIEYKIQHLENPIEKN